MELNGNGTRKKQNFFGAQKKKKKKHNDDEKRKKKLGIMYWNREGVNNKNRDFWNSIKKWDIFGSSETWMKQVKKSKNN